MSMMYKINKNNLNLYYMNVMGLSMLNSGNTNIDLHDITTNNLTVLNSVNIPDNSLTISDTAGLQTALDTHTADIATNTSNISTNTSNISTNTSDITDLQNDKQDNLTSTTDINVRDINTHGDFFLKNSSGDTIFSVIDGSVLDASLKFFDDLGNTTLSIAGNTGNLTGGNTCSFDSLSANTLCQSPYFFNTGAQNTNVASCTRKDYVDGLISTKQDELTDSDNIKLRSLVLGNGYNPIPTNDGNLYAYTANLTTSLIVAGTNILTTLTGKEDSITSTTELTFENAFIKYLNVQDDTRTKSLLREHDNTGVVSTMGNPCFIEYTGDFEDYNILNMMYFNNDSTEANRSIDIDCDTDITGDLTINGTNVITEINTKQDTLTAGTDIEITAGNVINYTGGFSLDGICFGNAGGSNVDFDLSYPTDTFYFIDFLNIEEYRDTNYYTYTTPSPVTNTASQGLKILVSGVYEISYSFIFKNMNYTNRVNAKVQLYNDTTASARGQTHSYMRDDSFVVHSTNSCTFMKEFTANDYMKLQFSVSKNDTTYGDNLDGLRMLDRGTFSIKYLGAIPP